MRKEIGQVVRAGLVGFGGTLWGWGVVIAASGRWTLGLVLLVAGFSPVLAERILKELGFGESDKD